MTNIDHEEKQRVGGFLQTVKLCELSKSILDLTNLYQGNSKLSYIQAYKGFNRSIGPYPGSWCVKSYLHVWINKDMVVFKGTGAVFSGSAEVSSG